MERPMKGTLDAALRVVPLRLQKDDHGALTFTCLEVACDGVARVVDGDEVACTVCGYSASVAVTRAVALAAVRHPARRAELTLRDVARGVADLPVPPLAMYRDVKGLHADALAVLRLQVGAPE